MKKYIILITLLTAFIGQTQIKAQTNRNLSTDSLINSFIAQINADSLQSYMQDLENFGTRFLLANNRRDVALWIKDKFISFGYSDVRLDSFQLTVVWPFGSTTSYTTWQYNVESTLIGSTNPDDIYILGAHHDAIVNSTGNPFTFAPGADDNASGVAVALEIARIFKLNGFVPSSTIRFVTFAAEELGLHGAYHYAGNAYANNENIKLMINNDMISYCSTPLAQCKIQIQKYPNSQWATDLANQVISQYTILDAVETTTLIQNSDSWAFHTYNYPSIFFIENQFSPFYHTAMDLVSSTNKNFAAEVTKISLGMLLSLNTNFTNINESTSSINKIFNYPNPFNEQTNINFSIDNNETISVQIFDATGRLVETLYNGYKQQGTYTLTWNATNVAPGIYFCKISNNKAQRVIKLVKKP